MTNRYDVIVAGVGGMGSAACFHLARRGLRVLGLDRYDIPNAQGSSHGETRIIRLAYSESPAYVPLLARAFELWRETGETIDERLLYTTGSIDAGPPGSGLFEGSLASCLEHGIRHETMTGAEVNRRYPGYRLPDDHLCLLQPDGGFVLPERSIVAHVTMAQAHGADIRAHEPGARLGAASRRRRAGPDPARGLRGGPAGALARRLDRRPRPGACAPSRCPSGRCSAGSSRGIRRGSARTPSRSATSTSRRAATTSCPVWRVPGLKIGLYHHLGETGHPDELPRATTAEDEAALRRCIARYFPDADGPIMALHACLFTNTPDEHFIIDTLPGVEEVLVVSPCSGHGFKFVPVVGEIVADLVTTGQSRFDLSMFRLDRF